MLDFSVNSTVSAVSTNRNQLEPYKIHTVKYEESKIDEFDGKTNGQHYKVLRVRFGNEDGYFDETLFFPTKAEDGEMREFTNGDGSKSYMPSSFDRTKYFMMQVMQVLNPEGFKKFQEASKSFKSFDNMAEAFIKVMDQVKGKETKLKLMGRVNANGNTMPALPSFLRVNRDKQLYVASNFIGDRLYFTTYEEGRMQNAKTAKPTNMPDLSDLTSDNYQKNAGSYAKEEKKEDVIDVNDLLGL